MFTVIIPLYNKAPYVEKAIRSVLVQTFQEFELIVVDDGSTDNSFDIVQHLFNSGSASPPKGGFRGASQENSGVSTARNNGVALAKYPYICFLDADDWWAPTYLEEMKVLIDDFPEAGIFGTSYYKVKNGKHIPANIGVEEGFERGLINYCKVYAKTLWMPLWTGAVCMPKNIFEEESGFKPNLKLGEDFDLWIRVAMKHPVALLNKPLSYYNQDVDVANRGVVDEKIYEPSTFITFNLDFLSEYENFNHELKILLDRLRVYSLLRYKIKGKYSDLVEKIIQTVDFNNVDRKYFIYYNCPRYLVKLWFDVMKIGSRIKKRINRK